MKFQLVAPYRVSHLQCYGDTIRGNVTSVDPPLRMRNVSKISCRENQNLHFRFHNFFFKHAAVYEIIWKYILQSGRLQMQIRCTRIAYRIPKATNTHSDYVMLIAFPLQQWLHERASKLRYAYIPSLVNM